MKPNPNPNASKVSIVDRGQREVLTSYDKVLITNQNKDQETISAREYLTSTKYKNHGTSLQRLEKLIGKHKSGTKRIFGRFAVADALLGQVRRATRGASETFTLQDRGTKGILESNDYVKIRKWDATGKFIKNERLSLIDFLTDPQYAVTQDSWQNRFQNYFGPIQDTKQDTKLSLNESLYSLDRWLIISLELGNFIEAKKKLNPQTGQ